MKKFLFIMILLALVLVSGYFFYQTTNEDMTSEPTLKVYVNGMDTVDYWLDLLILEDEINYQRIFTDRIRETVSVLDEYQDDEGYRPAILGGSEEKFVGRFDGSMQKDGSYRHEFWGIGIPDEFKVAILTRDNRLIISDVVKIEGYHSEVRFNFDELDDSLEIVTGVGQIKEVLPWTRIIFSFFIRLLAAILIKLAISDLFGFDSKKSIGVLLKTNTATQVILNILLISQMFFGAKYALMVFAVTSVIILVVESIIYSIFLEERDKKMRIINALVANIASAVAGYSLIYFVEWVSF